MYDLTHLSLQNITDIGINLRGISQEADSLETVANRCTKFFYENLRDETTGDSACVLARFFRTQNYETLPEFIQAQARKAIGATAAEEDTRLGKVKCLTLLATQGEKAEWCDRKLSQGHQTIPLTNEQAVNQIPMISQLIKDLGLEINSVVAPDPDLLLTLEQKTCNVFHIPTALGSQFIPAQTDFVEPYGVKSVLGFGGMLPSGNLFAVILFTKSAIPAKTARLFKSLPLSIKMAMIPFDNTSPFAAVTPCEPSL
ncbi:MAG: sensor histidine kinase, partial [Cyanobacteria bacterium P01_D01_bin.105]